MDPSARFIQVSVKAGIGSAAPVTAKEAQCHLHTVVTAADYHTLSYSYSTQSPRERLLLWQTFTPILSAVAASSALTFDHGKAWLAWPLPPLFGLYAGALLANVFGGLQYLLLGRS